MSIPMELRIRPASCQEAKLRDAGLQAILHNHDSYIMSSLSFHASKTPWRERRLPSPRHRPTKVQLETVLGAGSRPCSSDNQLPTNHALAVRSCGGGAMAH
jgi:hypothetical protein